MNDRIQLTDFTFDTLVGILEREQRTPQPLAVQIWMELPLESCARTEDLSESINYADVQQWVLTLARDGCWPLIESLSHAMARLILSEPAPCEPRAQIHAVEIELRKPTILDGAVPGIRIRRTAEWADVPPETSTTGVSVGVLERTPKREALRAVLSAGAQWTVPEPLNAQVIGGSAIVHRPTSGPEPLAVGDRAPIGTERTIEAAEGGCVVLAVGKIGPDF
ncbi:MAG: dihydroneopterin aldolase [Myxococcota bacterium]